MPDTIKQTRAWAQDYAEQTGRTWAVVECLTNTVSRYEPMTGEQARAQEADGAVRVVEYCEPYID